MEQEPGNTKGINILIDLSECLNWEQMIYLHRKG